MFVYVRYVSCLFSCYVSLYMFVMFHVCFLVMLVCPTVFFVYVFVNVRYVICSFLVIIFAMFLIGGGAHYPGEFGVLEHPP